jgi:hypothetical protein
MADSEPAAKLARREATIKPVEDREDDPATEQVGRPFEPRRYLVRINGRGEYLEVKWRLVWLRSEHPDAQMVTELIRGVDDYALFKATVAIPGGGMATGWGSETAGDFRDFLEKAETKAIGRALAALGYGTQFCDDHNFGAADNRVVDSPVDPPPARGHVAPPGGPTGPSQLAQATERQVKFIHAIAREAGLDDAELESWSQELFGCGVQELNRRDASTLIESIQRRRNEVP